MISFFRMKYLYMPHESIASRNTIKLTLCWCFRKLLHYELQYNRGIWSVYYNIILWPDDRGFVAIHPDHQRMKEEDWFLRLSMKHTVAGPDLICTTDNNTIENILYEWVDDWFVNCILKGI